VNTCLLGVYLIVAPGVSAAMARSRSLRAIASLAWSARLSQSLIDPGELCKASLPKLGHHLLQVIATVYRIHQFERYSFLQRSSSMREEPAMRGHSTFLGPTAPLVIGFFKGKASIMRGESVPLHRTYPHCLLSFELNSPF